MKKLIRLILLACTLLLAFYAVIMIRYQVFEVPSSAAMLPTLEEGDYVFVRKAGASDLDYGQLVAFRVPGSESEFFIAYSTAPETKSFRFDPNRPRPEGGDVDTSAGDTVMGYKIGSFYITELCDALT